MRNETEIQKLRGLMMSAMVESLRRDNPAESLVAYSCVDVLDWVLGYKSETEAMMRQVNACNSSTVN